METAPQNDTVLRTEMCQLHILTGYAARLLNSPL